MRSDVSDSRWSDVVRIENFDFQPYSNERLNEILHIQSKNLNSEIQCRAEIVSIPDDSVVIIFSPEVGINFQFSEKLLSESDGRRNFFLNQWASALVIFIRAFEINRELRGTCQLWLDDRPRYPGITFSGNSISHLCLPDPVFLSSIGYRDAEYAYKMDAEPWTERNNKVFWRGSTTGIRPPYQGTTWRDLPRLRMCLAVEQFHRPDLFDVGLSRIVQINDAAEVEEIMAQNIMAPEVHPAEFMKYKYSIDIDGNVNSWPGLFIKLIFKNTILKVDNLDGYRQWYYDKLIPWNNYVPISSDFKELVEVSEWLMRHPEKSEAIAQSARDLADQLKWDYEIDIAAVNVIRYVSSGISYIYK